MLNRPHFCPEWDYDYILPNTPEMRACICREEFMTKVRQELTFVERELALEIDIIEGLMQNLALRRHRREQLKERAYELKYNTPGLEE
jgi:hypothetical protein